MLMMVVVEVLPSLPLNLWKHFGHQKLTNLMLLQLLMMQLVKFLVVVVVVFLMIVVGTFLNLFLFVCLFVCLLLLYSVYLLMN